MRQQQRHKHDGLLCDRRSIDGVNIKLIFVGGTHYTLAETAAAHLLILPPDTLCFAHHITQSTAKL